MQTLDQSLADLVEQGLIDVDQARLAAKHPEGFSQVKV
jgi:Tfp pilus assembly pilus retraction ATPase PilT